MHEDDKPLQFKMFYVSNEELTPIDKIETVDFSDYDTQNIVSAFDNMSVTIHTAFKDPVNKLVALLYGVNVRVLHLMKYGKTKRVRKKNRKRFVYTRLKL